MPPEQPILSKPVYDTEGFSLVIIEEDTEVSIKGTQFINDLMRSDENWKRENFILLTTKPDSMEKIAKKLNVSLFEKPIRQSALKQLIAERLKKEEEIQLIAQKIIESRKLTYKEKKVTTKKSLSTSKIIPAKKSTPKSTPKSVSKPTLKTSKKKTKLSVKRK